MIDYLFQIAVELTQSKSGAGSEPGELKFQSNPSQLDLVIVPANGLTNVHGKSINALESAKMINGGHLDHEKIKKPERTQDVL